MSRNRFELLEVQEPSESLQLSPAEVALLTRGKSTGAQEPIDIDELEMKKDVEEVFAIFCFFKDLRRIQNRFKQTWTDCSAGRISLIVATAVTQTAVFAIQRAEENLVTSVLKLSSETAADAYKLLAGKLMFLEPLTVISKQQQDPTVALQVSPFDDFIYLPAARILSKFQVLAPMHVAWPPPIPSMRIQFLDNPELANTAQHKKLQRDEEFLMQMLLDM